MSIWTRLFGPRPQRIDRPDEEPAPHGEQIIDLPSEPFVFECQSCGKVFEARRKRPFCPECDSTEVELLG